MASNLRSTAVAIFLVRLVLVCLLFISTTPGWGNTAEQAQQLAQRVAQIAQLWQNGEELTAQQLHQTIERTESLTQEVTQSSDPHKKLLLIRLKKSLQLYQYMLKVKQEK